MSSPRGPGDDPVQALLAVYDEALPVVYGYVLRRCGDRRVAEDVTSETFVAAMDTARGAAGGASRTRPAVPSVPWLIGVARHKLADHWRRMQRTPDPVADPGDNPAVRDNVEDPWEAELDRMVAHQTLHQLSPVHRAALTLRYVDDLPVAECARILCRTHGATEALLTRAKRAFRSAYPGPRPPSDASKTEGGRR